MKFLTRQTANIIWRRLATQITKAITIGPIIACTKKKMKKKIKMNKKTNTYHKKK
jgi:hypothetical protein